MKKFIFFFCVAFSLAAAAGYSRAQLANVRYAMAQIVNNIILVKTDTGYAPAYDCDNKLSHVRLISQGRTLHSSGLETQFERASLKFRHFKALENAGAAGSVALGLSAVTDAAAKKSPRDSLIAAVATVLGTICGYEVGYWYGEERGCFTPTIQRLLDEDKVWDTASIVLAERLLQTQESGNLFLRALRHRHKCWEANPSHAEACSSATEDVNKLNDLDIRLGEDKPPSADDFAFLVQASQQLPVYTPSKEETP